MISKSLLLSLFLLLRSASAQNTSLTSSDSMNLKGKLDSLIQLARDYTDKGEFDIALELNRMAESIAINEFGKESVAYSDVCFNHGRILYLTNNKALFTDALRWFMDAMNVIEKLLGKENSKYALCLSNIGKLKSKFGETKEAETLYLSALEIWRSATFLIQSSMLNVQEISQLFLLKSKNLKVQKH